MLPSVVRSAAVLGQALHSVPELLPGFSVSDLALPGLSASDLVLPGLSVPDLMWPALSVSDLA